MLRRMLWVPLIFIVFVHNAIGKETHKLEMTLCDTFSVSDTDDWSVEVERYLTLRFADIKITSKNGYDFNMKLFFKSDTEDIARFNSQRKIEQSVLRSTKGYLPYIVEKQIKLKPVPLQQTYGYYTVITDAKLAKAAQIPTREYKYMTRGLYRTSPDTVLGFSIMTNDISSSGYTKLLDYVYSFIKKASNKSIKPTQKNCTAHS